MAKTTLIRKGESLPFIFDRGGQDIDGWICTIFLKQYPSDTAILSRVIAADGNKNQWSGFLTQSETAPLAKGLYYLTGKLTNSSTDEEEQIPLRFRVGTEWA